MRGERSFYNGRTEQHEVFLTRGSFEERIHWFVCDKNDARGAHYPDTDEGYAAALIEYERRVAEAQKDKA